MGWRASPTRQVQFQVLPRTSFRGKGRQSISVSKLTAVAHEWPLTDHELPLTDHDLPLTDYERPLTDKKTDRQTDRE